MPIGLLTKKLIKKTGKFMTSDAGAFTAVIGAPIAGGAATAYRHKKEAEKRKKQRRKKKRYK